MAADLWAHQRQAVEAGAAAPCLGRPDNADQALRDG